MNFIIALNEDDKNLLLYRGYSFISTQKMGNDLAYIFANKPKKIENFSNDEKKRFIITNKFTLS